MKKCLFALFFILVILALGGLYLALRPALEPDTMQDVSAPKNMTLALSDEREKSGLLHVEYDWDLSNSPNDTLLIGKDRDRLFSLIQPATWHISCRIQDGACVLTTTPPTVHAKDASSNVRAQFLAEFGLPYKQRHPDGTIHTMRTISLVCELWLYRPFFQKPLHAFAIQEIKLDLIDGSADLIRPHGALFGKPGLQYHFVTDKHKADLPALYCGTPTEQLMLRVLHNMAAIDSASKSKLFTPNVLKYAQELLSLQSDSSAPWPDCWGEDAPVARRLARRIVPTLLRLQEDDCYNNQELIHFINSQDFSRIFGDKFDTEQPPLTDMEPIIFEKK